MSAAGALAMGTVDARSSPWRSSPCCARASRPSVFLLAAFQAVRSTPLASGIGAVLGHRGRGRRSGFGIYRGGVRLEPRAVLPDHRCRAGVRRRRPARVRGAHGARGRLDRPPARRQALDLTWLVEPGTRPGRAAHRDARVAAAAHVGGGRRAGSLYAIPMTIYVLWPLGRRATASHRHPSSTCPDRRARDRQAMTRSRSVRSAASSPSIALTACGDRLGRAAPTRAAANGVTTVEVAHHRRRLRAGRASRRAAGRRRSRSTNADAGRGDASSRSWRATASSARPRTSRPGSTGQFSLTLEPGTYTTYVPGRDDDARARSIVTGAGAVASTRAQVGEPRSRGGLPDVRRDRRAQLVTAHEGVRRRRDRPATSSGRKSLFASARDLRADRAGGRVVRRPRPAIDAREGDVPDDEWTGFHRIEKALWVDGSTRRDGAGRGASSSADVDEARSDLVADRRAASPRRSPTARPSCSTRCPPRRSPARRTATRTPTCGTSRRTSTGRAPRSTSLQAAARAAGPGARRREIDAAVRRGRRGARPVPDAATASSSTRT